MILVGCARLTNTGASREASGLCLGRPSSWETYAPNAFGDQAVKSTASFPCCEALQKRSGTSNNHVGLGSRDRGI